jgi:hypothetical protein
MKRNSTCYSFYISPNLKVRGLYCVWTLIRADSLYFIFYFIFFTFVSSGLSVGKYEYLIIFLIHTCFVTFIICLRYLYKLCCLLLYCCTNALYICLHCLTDSISLKIYGRWINMIMIMIIQRSLVEVCMLSGINVMYLRI